MILHLIYEFTLKYQLNLSDEQIMIHAENHLKSEAIIQEWEKGYILKRENIIKYLPDGTREYHFKVFGKYKTKFHYMWHADGEQDHGKSDLARWCITCQKNV